MAVVTGGAGAIGAAICTTLAAAGAMVVVADRDEARTAETLDTVERARGRAVAWVGDLTAPDAVDALVALARDEAGGIDILVNALGEHLQSAGAHEDSTEETWQALYEINLLHVFRLCRAVIPLMKKRRSGSIVNFSSVEGIRAAPALAVYAAFKAGVDAFTKSLAVDVGGHGVRVNAIAVDKTRSYQVGHYALPDEYASLVHTWIPTGRYGEPQEIANATLFLASDLGSWVTGHTLVADGGTLAAGGWYRTTKRWTNQPLLVQYFDDDPRENERRPPAVQ